MAGPGRAPGADTHNNKQGSRSIAQVDGPGDRPPQPNPQPRQNPFGGSVGYDPARDPHKSQQLEKTAAQVVGGRVDLPASAYKIAGKVYAFPSDLPLRPKDLNSSGKAIQVRVNQFKVTQWPQKKVYQYDIQVGQGVEKRGLIKAVWESKAIQDQLHAIDKWWLWDGNRIAWCSAKSQRQEWRIDVDMDRERGRQPRMDKSTGKPVNNVIRVVIKCTGEINMAVIKAYLDRKMEFDNTVLEAVNFLDHCLRQYPSTQYVQIKRSFFSRGDNRFPLDDVIEAMKGVYSSIRLSQPIGSTGTSTGLACNVDVSNGTFWVTQALDQAARNYCSARNRNKNWLVFRDILSPVKYNDGWTMSPDFKELRKLVKLKFILTHRGKKDDRKVYTIKGFVFHQKYGREGGHAKNVTFMHRDKKNPNNETEISVYDYFVKTYDIHLDRWYLPLVETTKDGLFPMELCMVAPNQRYMYKLSSDQTAKMIKFAVTRPKERLGAIKHGVGMLKWNEDPWMKHYGLVIDPNLTLTNARLLQNPEIQFNGSKLNPGTSGRWDLRGKKFLKTNPQPLSSWGVCIIDQACNNNTLQNFLKVLIQTYIGHGGNVTNRSPFVHDAGKSTNYAEAVTATRLGAGNQAQIEPQILVFIMKDRNSQTYERIKKSMDCRYGIVSQVLNAAHVLKASPQYCSNVCMKINAKLGGTTARVAGKDMKTAAPFFSVPTMIIGSDVSHPTPGSPQASMAALTMSMDQEAVRYAAAVQTNGIRVEMITRANIISMMMPLFHEWIKKVGGGRGPSHIYYFRDGVSEGQYMHVLDEEVKDMKSAIREKYGPVNIKFTVIVCSKRHHIRFLPKDNDSAAGDRNGNPLPGTLVERDVTHPFEYDFYLNSHSAIQGTARPVHYHVLLDEANVPANKLHAMIYQHCYQYIRSTTPVSLYPAVYYAHLASNRARAHEDAASDLGPRGGQKFEELLQRRNQLQTAGVLPAGSLNTIRSTEAKPLITLGALGSDNAKATIKTSMWYI